MMLPDLKLTEAINEANQRLAELEYDLKLVEVALTTGQKTKKKTLAQAALARVRARLGLKVE